MQRGAGEERDDVVESVDCSTWSCIYIYQPLV